MDNFTAENDLKILDNLSIAGITREEHNQSFSELLAAARKHNFTFNENKSIKSVDTVRLLGYAFSHKSIKSDPEWLETCIHRKTKNQSNGWLEGFLNALNSTYSGAENGIYRLKKDTEVSVVTSIDKTLPFVTSLKL